MTQTIITAEPSYRPAGRAAIASGIVGIASYAFLIIGMGRPHDVGAILQYLLMIPVAVGLYKLANQGPSAMNNTSLIIGIGAIILTVLFLLLIFPKILSEALYMFPQGVFGVWLMIVCAHMSGILSRGLKWFGMVVGLGLALVGIFPVGYAIFVDGLILQIPAASDEAIQKIPFDTPANNILHLILYIGSFIGVLTFPIWSILIGRKLLWKRN